MSALIFNKFLFSFVKFEVGLVKNQYRGQQKYQMEHRDEQWCTSFKAVRCTSPWLSFVTRILHETHLTKPWPISETRRWVIIVPLKCEWLSYCLLATKKMASPFLLKSKHCPSSGPLTILYLVLCSDVDHCLWEVYIQFTCSDALWTRKKWIN